MKKICFALLLIPCLSFAAYPIYEIEHENKEVRLSSEEEQLIEEYKALHKRRQALRAKQQAIAYEEEAVANDNDIQGDREIALEQEPAQSGGSPNSLQEKQSQGASSATPPSEQRKQAAAVGDRASGKKNGSAQNSSSSRSKVQRSRQNPNRPRVTQRKQGESRASQGQIEAATPADVEGYELKGKEHTENHEQADSKKKSSLESEKKSSYNQSSKKSLRRDNDSTRLNRQSKRFPGGRGKYQQKKIKSQHPGKRPVSP